MQVQALQDKLNLNASRYQLNSVEGLPMSCVQCDFRGTRNCCPSIPTPASIELAGSGGPYSCGRC